MGAVLGAVPCVVERLRVDIVCSRRGVGLSPVPLPGSCRAAWKWQVEPMLNGVSHMDRQVLPLRWMLAGAKRYARKRSVYKVYTRTMTRSRITWPTGCRARAGVLVESQPRRSS